MEFDNVFLQLQAQQISSVYSKVKLEFHTVSICSVDSFFKKGGLVYFYSKGVLYRTALNEDNFKRLVAEAFHENLKYESYKSSIKEDLFQVESTYEYSFYLPQPFFYSFSDTIS